jgi:hypothetical protein
MNSEELAAHLQEIEAALSRAVATRTIPATARQALYEAIDSVVAAQRILLAPVPTKIRQQ